MGVGTRRRGYSDQLRALVSLSVCRYTHHAAVYRPTRVAHTLTLTFEIGLRLWILISAVPCPRTLPPLSLFRLRALAIWASLWPPQFTFHNSNHG